MGTRGALGFRVNGEDKLMYNHFDSYPEGLGSEVLEFLRGWEENPLEQLALSDQPPRSKKEILAHYASLLRDVEGTEPTDEDVVKYDKWADWGVNGGRTNDWYALLRKTQGDLRAILECGVFTGSNDFILNSLFCEWAYIVNCDEGVLEVYKGFVSEPHNEGRYAKRTEDIERRKKVHYDQQTEALAAGRIEVRKPLSPSYLYYPCALLCSFDLEDLPTEVEFMTKIVELVPSEEE
jgi:hypothetical protein